MQTEKVKVIHGGVEFSVTAETILRNLLESLQQRPQAVKLTIPAIGEPWQGGIFAGLMRGADGGPDYFLIVSPPETHLEDVQWGSHGKEEPAISEWDGLANTKALVASEHDHPAAQKIAALREGGFDDWYLPAKRELSICYGNVPELFQKAWYWSSTQYSADSAWYQSFYGGTQGAIDKYYEFRAFAVRRVLSIQ